MTPEATKRGAGGYHPKHVRGTAIAEVADDDLLRLGDADARILPPWLREFGRWLSEKKRPVADQLARIFDLTGETWTLPRLNELKLMGAFHEYVVIMHERGIRAAKERLGEITYNAVEGLAEGIADTRNTKEWATMSKLTGQVLERAMPRREDLMQQNLQVNILLSPKQLALEENDSIEVVTEPIAPDTV